MLNLIKSDIYILTHAKYFWICFIINIILSVGTIYILDLSYKATEGMEDKVVSQQETLKENGVTISDSTLSVLKDKSASDQMLSFFANTGNTILFAIIISLFVGGEFSHGTIKNMATKNYSRLKIYTSKLIISIVISVILAVLSVLSASLTATALWGFGSPSSGFWLNILKGSALELLLISSLSSLFVMFSILIRQNGGALALNICSLEFLFLAAMLIQMIINKITGKTIAISNYLPHINMQQVGSMPFSQSLVTKSLAVGLIFLIAAFIIGYISFQKRDIK